VTNAPERAPRRYMLRYAAELVVVFFGVWLSLAAEDWRQSRADTATARASISRMAADLASDIRDLEINEDRAGDGVMLGRWLLGRGAEDDAPADSVNRSLSAIQFCSMFVENNGEYESLRNSGRLGIIRDADLRSRIVSHYESRRFIHSLHAVDCENNVTVFDLMAPFVSVTEPPQALPTGQVVSDGFVDSSRPRVTAVSTPAALLRGVEFRAQLTNLVSYRHFLLGQIAAQKDATQALREELLRELR
jgi:hypothetical protein